MHITVCDGDKVLWQHCSSLSHEEGFAAALESLPGKNDVFLYYDCNMLNTW